ncbi:HalOD1 output domain-containing protein [Halostella litorea]|uniref:HalOD1 output domain-containing protein n=1 Tax=Halostella litorea TaxID=2528831 RepID=UPI001091D16F|nr:HalOD1 output domain-containing protein [Halostella litorea]
MSNSDETRERYEPDQNRELSTAVLGAIEDQTGKDLTNSEFQLYDDINPDALNNLFREDASANTTVQFDTDSVTVTLWGDGAVEIQVSSQDEDG